LGGKEEEERMEGIDIDNAWTVVVASGDGTEMRAGEALIRDVVTASEHNPGVVFYVPEGLAKRRPAGKSGRLGERRVGMG
jgi:diacylglycerol kinase family enzyme